MENTTHNQIIMGNNNNVRDILKKSVPPPRRENRGGKRKGAGRPMGEEKEIIIIRITTKLAKEYGDGDVDKGKAVIKSLIIKSLDQL